MALYSRTPHGVRGLKYLSVDYYPIYDGRTPHGVRGLKYLPTSHRRGTEKVAPLTGCVD